MADVHGTEQQRTEQNNTAPPVVPSTAATSTTQATPATSAGGSIPASTPAHQPAAQGVATSAATSTSHSAALGGTSTSTATQSPLPSIIPVNANDQGIDMWRLPPDSIQRQGSEPPPPPLPRNKAVQWSQGAVTQNQGQWMAAAQPTVMQPSGPQQAVPPPAPQATGASAGSLHGLPAAMNGMHTSHAQATLAFQSAWLSNARRACGQDTHFDGQSSTIRDFVDIVDSMAQSYNLTDQTTAQLARSLLDGEARDYIKTLLPHEYPAHTFSWRGPQGLLAALWYQYAKRKDLMEVADALSKAKRQKQGESFSAFTSRLKPLVKNYVESLFGEGPFSIAPGGDRTLVARTFNSEILRKLWELMLPAFKKYLEDKRDQFTHYEQLCHAARRYESLEIGMQALSLSSAGKPKPRPAAYTVNMEEDQDKCTCVLCTNHPRWCRCAECIAHNRELESAAAVAATNRKGQRRTGGSGRAARTPPPRGQSATTARSLPSGPKLIEKDEKGNCFFCGKVSTHSASTCRLRILEENKLKSEGKKLAYNAHAEGYPLQVIHWRAENKRRAQAAATSSREMPEDTEGHPEEASLATSTSIIPASRSDIMYRSRYTGRHSSGSNKSPETNRRSEKSPSPNRLDIRGLRRNSTQQGRGDRERSNSVEICYYHEEPSSSRRARQPSASRTTPPRQGSPRDMRRGGTSSKAQASKRRRHTKSEANAKRPVTSSSSKSTSGSSSSDNSSSSSSSSGSASGDAKKCAKRRKKARSGSPDSDKTRKLIAQELQKILGSGLEVNKPLAAKTQADAQRMQAADGAAENIASAQEERPAASVTVTQPAEASATGAKPQGMLEDVTNKILQTTMTDVRRLLEEGIGHLTSMACNNIKYALEGHPLSQIGQMHREATKAVRAAVDTAMRQTNTWYAQQQANEMYMQQQDLLLAQTQQDIRQQQLALAAQQLMNAQAQSSQPIQWGPNELEAQLRAVENGSSSPYSAQTWATPASTSQWQPTSVLSEEPQGLLQADPAAGPSTGSDVNSTASTEKELTGESNAQPPSQSPRDELLINSNECNKESCSEMHSSGECSNNATQCKEASTPEQPQPRTSMLGQAETQPSEALVAEETGGEKAQITASKPGDTLLHDPIGDYPTIKDAQEFLAKRCQEFKALAASKRQGAQQEHSGQNSSSNAN